MRRTIGLALVLVTGAALVAASPVAAATPGYCRGDATLDIAQLPERIDLARCDIVGRTIEAGGLRVVVPPPGQRRTVHALRTTGETNLDVRTSPDGEVLVSQSQEEEVSSSATQEQVVAATAAPNDSFATPEVVTTPSYTWFRDGTTVDATVEAADAQADSTCMTAPDKAPDRSVWYRYVAPHSGPVQVKLANVNPAGAVVRAQVFVGAGLNFVRCTTEPVYLTKGKAYYVRVGSVGTPASFRLTWAPPAPPNDAFAKARSVTISPFYSGWETWKMTGATLQSGEPAPSCKTTTTGTVWHKVDPGTLRWLSINGGGTSFALHRGGSLSTLKPVTCRSGTWGDKVNLPGGGTYYIQQWVKPGVERATMSVTSGEPHPDLPPPCEDSNYFLMSGVDGRKPLNWRFNGTNVPASLGTAALSQVKQGIGIVTSSKNDCGLADQVSAQQSFLGNTGRVAGLCATSTPDGLNVVDFGTSDYSVLGTACSSSSSTDGINWVISETDIRLSRQAAWTLKPDAPGCYGKVDLVGVVAHEAGHAFGLDHPYSQGNLTMAAYSSDCTSAFRTLGRGDVLGLRALY